jgi:hypothetical protein
LTSRFASVGFSPDLHEREEMARASDDFDNLVLFVEPVSHETGQPTVAPDCHAVAVAHLILALIVRMRIVIKSINRIL